jgi:hypothetical protein
MCFVWLWEQTAIISLYSINWLVFITQTKCVYCAERNKSFYVIQIKKVSSCELDKLSLDSSAERGIVCNKQQTDRQTVQKQAVSENCALLGHYTASISNSLRTFRDKPSVNNPRFLTLEDGNDMLPRNVGNSSNKLPTRCNKFPVYCPDVYLQLNLFRAFSRPSSGARWLQ